MRPEIPADATTVAAAEAGARITANATAEATAGQATARVTARVTAGVAGTDAMADARVRAAPDALLGVSFEPTPLVVVGDALLDRDLTGTSNRLTPDSRVPVVEDCTERLRPGGAALAAYLAAREGREVTLVAALGDDPASRRLRALLDGWVTLVPLPLDGTLAEKTRILDRGQPLVRLDRGTGRAAGSTEAARAAVGSARALLVADYGRGSADSVRGVIAELAHRAPVVWDPHPRGRPPVRGTPLVTPATEEARHFAALLPGAAHCAELRSIGQRAQALVHGWGVRSVAVTLGARGALLSYGRGPVLMPASHRYSGDACGAGDQFAAAAASMLADGATAEEAVRAAVAAATEYVAEGGAGALAFPSGTEHPTAEEDAQQLVDRIRANGGTVVAAGGCFDLLHAGHIGLLQSARRAGDCLVVCLNSDASVRRLKGAGRPIVPQADREHVLRALECVDAVAVFDEDTPQRLLDRLRPDVWVKGGDYEAAELPEAALLEQWGGRTMVMPYRDGRSSTSLASRAAAAAPEPHQPEPHHPGPPAPAQVRAHPDHRHREHNGTPVAARTRTGSDGP